MRSSAPTLELAEQQACLAAAITGVSLADARASGDAGSALAESNPALALIRGPEAATRLAVYHHAYRARLIEALRSNHPILHRVLGDDGFATLALAYLQAHPSNTPSIRWFGGDLVAFMSGKAPPELLPHPSLIDLARMEWSLGLSFDSADAPWLTPEHLMAVAPEHWPQLRFEFHPSVALLALDWAIEPVWSALTADEGAQADAPEASAHELLIWRQQLDTRWRSVPADEAALLRACMAGECFAGLCERALAFAGDGAAAFAAGALRRWVEDGLLSGVLALPDQHRDLE
jgi:hypothetical protein